MLVGRVVDADAQTALPSASVAVWRDGEGTSQLITGGITTPDGQFRLEGLRAGTYRVVVSFVGYVTLTQDSVRAEGRVDLGTLALAPDVEVLEGVEVNAARDRVEVQIDRTVYNVADDALAQSGTATTVLETIPSVDVDVEGNISLRGVGNVAILINGRPAPVSRDFLSAYLQSLPAGSLDRVEVIPNPSARYEPDGMGGVLNLVLKENTDLGLGGAITGGADSRGGYNGTALLTFGKGPLSLSASYGLRRSQRDFDGARYRINRFSDPLTILDQDILDGRTNTSQFGSLNVDWAVGPNSTLTLAGQAGVRSETEDETTTFLFQDANEIAINQYERIGTEEGDGWNGSARLGFRHDFGTAASRQEESTQGGGGRRGHGGPGGRGGRGGSQAANLGSHTLALEARFNASQNDAADLITEQGLDTGIAVEQQRTTDTDRDQEATIRADYSRPLAGFRLEVGYKGDFESLSSDFFSETLQDGVFLPDADLINAFDYDQQIHAGYLQVARQFGALGVQVGARAESATTTFALATTNESFDNAYTSLFPSGFLTYEVVEGTTLKASYSRRINRPRTRFLNPLPSVEDPLNIRQGNPFLQPEYVDAVEVGVVQFTSFGSLQLTPYARRTTDLIRRFQRLEEGVTISTFENFDSSTSYGVEAIASLQGTGSLEGLRSTLSLEGYRIVTDGSSVDTDLENDAFGWGGRLNASYALRTGLDVQTNLRYRAPMDTEQGSTGARTFLDLALRQRFLDDRASLTFQARDPLGLAGFDSIIDQPNLYQEYGRTFGGPSYGLSFTYAFGGERPQRQRQEGSDASFDDSDF